MLDEQAEADLGFQKVRRKHRRDVASKSGPMAAPRPSRSPHRAGTPAVTAPSRSGDILNAPDLDLEEVTPTPITDANDIDTRSGRIQEALPQVDGALLPGDRHQNQRGGGNLT